MPDPLSNDTPQIYVTGFASRFWCPTGMMHVKVSLIALQKGGDADPITSMLVTCLMGIEQHITTWSQDESPRPDYEEVFEIDQNTTIAIYVRARLVVKKPPHAPPLEP